MTIASLVTDAVITHSVNLLRYQATVRSTVTGILTAMQRELLGRLAGEELSGIARTRLNMLLNQANRIITGHYETVLSELRSAAQGVAIAEAKANVKWIDTVFGVHIDATLPAPDHMRALADNSLVFGAQAGAWWKRQGDDTAFRYAAAVRQGVAQGEPNSQIVRRIVGTKGGAPGIVQVSAGNAAKLVHQSVQTVANVARLETFRANADVIRGVRQVSTLDQKTSDICVAYDGAAWDLEGEPIDGNTLPFNEGPPRHWNCRSVLVPITKTFADLGIDLPEPGQSGRASIDGPTKKGNNIRAVSRWQARGFPERVARQGQGATVAGWQNHAATVTGSVRQSVDLIRTPGEIRLGPRGSAAHILPEGKPMVDTPEFKAALKAAVDEATAGLADKNKQLLSELKEARKGKAIDPAEVEALENKIESLTSDLQAANKVAKEAQKQAETVSGQLQAETKFTQKLLVDNGLTDALTSAGVRPELLPFVKARLMPDATVVADGDARTVKFGDKDMATFIKEWSQGADAKHVIAAQPNAGGGAGGGGGSGGAKNPWAKDTFNLTEQGRIVTENPQLAATLQAAAG